MNTELAACHPRHKPEGMSSKAWLELWFPTRVRVTFERDPYAAGRAICATCRISKRCLAEALKEERYSTARMRGTHLVVGYRFGLRGLDPEEREQITNMRRKRIA